MFLLVLATTGANEWLHDVSGLLASHWFQAEDTATLTRWLYPAALLLVHEAGNALTAFFGGFPLDRRYGVCTQSIWEWWADRAKSLILVALAGGIGVAVVYWTMNVSPTWWWLFAGAVFAVLLVGMANVAPVVLLPIFYRIEPLSRQSLRTKLLALAERAETRVLGVYEWGLRGKSRQANAALTGLGASRRILVSDTMLTDYSDDEIEVVLAHEIAHHVHGDIWKSLLFEGGVMLAGLFVASKALALWAGPRGPQGISDIAGLPVLLLAVSGVFLAASPAAQAWSRARERSADRYAIALTGNPTAFVSAMRRLGAQNLAEEHPSPIVRWLFHSHPTIPERIAAAETLRR